ncbi:MAG: DUF1501 domain-containing protein [Planctomycetaceae bacterium]
MHPLDHLPATRRHFCTATGAGFGSLALLSMLNRDNARVAAAETVVAAAAGPLAARPAPLPARAKSVIFLFMFGGPSQMDLFDHKPELAARDGQSIENEFRTGAKTKAVLQASRRSCRRHGESGQWGSDALPQLARHADKLCFVKSLHSDSFAHGSALLEANTGRILQGHPSIGSWVTYGLGSESADLPGYVVLLDPRGLPTSGVANWASGYMPAAFQGTVLRTEGGALADLGPPPGFSRGMQRREIDFMNRLNESHRAGREEASELAARISVYELAYRLQAAAPEALDIADETAETRALYGIDEPKPDWHRLALGPAPFGRRCLVARRLVERGVRFVQIYSGGGGAGGQQSWDGHHGIEENLSIHCPEIDRPVAGLLEDLSRRGLLDSTLVVWGGEFGRMPVAETYNTGGKPGGRDHNPRGFTYFLAGGGVRGGMSYGATDESGEKAAENPRHLRDLHATILHLLGFDHRRLTYFRGGLEEKLTGVVEARPIREIMA